VDNCLDGEAHAFARLDAYWFFSAVPTHPGGTCLHCGPRAYPDWPSAPTELSGARQLLLNMTCQITSNLELREVLRVVSANIRDVVHFDLAVISLLDRESGNLRVYAVNCPHSKGSLKEDLLICPEENDPKKRAIVTLYREVGTQLSVSLWLSHRDNCFQMIQSYTVFPFPWLSFFAGGRQVSHRPQSTRVSLTTQRR